MWQPEKYEDTLEGVAGYFEDRLKEDPKGVLQEIEGELKSLYIRLDQDWTGRGIVADTVLAATVAALERVRAKCLESLL